MNDAVTLPQLRSELAEHFGGAHFAKSIQFFQNGTELSDGLAIDVSQFEDPWSDLTLRRQACLTDLLLFAAPARSTDTHPISLSRWRWLLHDQHLP